MDVPTDPDEALALAVHELYAASPGEFVATRTSLAKELRGAKHRDAARQLTGMRKPSVAAAAVNAVVRAGDPVVGRLVELGGQLRHATSAMDGRALAALRTDRDELLRDWVRAAAEHGGGSSTAAVETEVRDTAVAALADAHAVEVVTSGHLTRSLSYSGFGEVDLADAVARTSTGVVLTRIEGGRVHEGEEPEEPEEPDEAPTGAESEVGAGESEGGGLEDEGVDEDDEDEEGEDEQAEVGEGPEPGEDPAAERERQLDEAGKRERQLDEAEKVVAAARADRRRAVRSEAEAEERVDGTAATVTRAEEALRQASAELESARVAHAQAVALLAAAQEERGRAEEALIGARDHRDDARAALEEAEDA